MLELSQSQTIDLGQLLAFLVMALRIEQRLAALERAVKNGKGAEPEGPAPLHTHRPAGRPDL